MPADAIREMKEFQPVGAEADTHPLYLLSRFQNADKHRALVLLASGLTDVVTTVEARSSRIQQILPEPEAAKGFVDEGWQVVHVGWNGTPPLKR